MPYTHPCSKYTCTHTPGPSPECTRSFGTLPFSLEDLVLLFVLVFLFLLFFIFLLFLLVVLFILFFYFLLLSPLLSPDFFLFILSRPPLKREFRRRLILIDRQIRDEISKRPRSNEEKNAQPCVGLIKFSPLVSLCVHSRYYIATNEMIRLHCCYLVPLTLILPFLLLHLLQHAFRDRDPNSFPPTVN